MKADYCICAMQAMSPVKNQRSKYKLDKYQSDRWSFIINFTTHMNYPNILPLKWFTPEMFHAFFGKKGLYTFQKISFTRTDSTYTLCYTIQITTDNFEFSNMASWTRYGLHSQYVVFHFA